MGSPLESLPPDLLHHCAILAGSSSTYNPPTEIARLCQTSSIMHNALDVQTSPNIYGRVFASKFDKAAICRRSALTDTDSALASDLQARYRLFRRSKRMDFSSIGLMEDLWTALWLFLESDGLNERQLREANFSTFILAVARMHLGAQSCNQSCQFFEGLVIWLTCLSLSRREIQALCSHDRDVLYCSILPYILSPQTPSVCEQNSRITPCKCSTSAIIKAPGTTSTAQRFLSTAYRRRPGNVPDPSIAAIHIACAITEAHPMKIPSHLPANRAIAIVDQLSGPTREDYHHWTSHATPMFADGILGDQVNDPSSDGRSKHHELEFRDLLRSIPLDARHPEIRYIPGMLTGLWEGTMRTLPIPANLLNNPDDGSNATSGVSFQKPIQCALREYTARSDDSTSNHSEALDQICASNFILNQDGSELCVRGYKYRKHDNLDATHSDSQGGNISRNVMLHAETLESHDVAWGGFRFWGGVYEDGRIVLKRVGKEEGDQGIWIFEGRLRFGAAFLGRWRVFGETGNVGVYHGVFSMRNVSSNWKE